jgi:hypothetical protein
MNRYDTKDTPLDFDVELHFKETKSFMWVCVNKKCDGEHHVYVRSHTH